MPNSQNALLPKIGLFNMNLAREQNSIKEAEDVYACFAIRWLIDAFVMYSILCIENIYNCR